MIDLRSDTVTKPTEAMRRAIASAEVGDDLFGEDPTVNRLQDEVADLLGHEAALFVPSGTMGNEIAIKLHTRPSDEVLCAQDSHIVHYETGAPALLSGVSIGQIPSRRGVFDPEALRRALHPDVFMMPRSRLLIVENTHNHAGGTVWPISATEDVISAARASGLALHLDGARLWNAAAALGCEPHALAASFDTVCVSLSKGLGAPIGSLLAGRRVLIEEAVRWRKLFGGGMRQVGLLAAAGRHALEHHRGLLVHDHERARRFAAVGEELGFEIAGKPVETNIVILDATPLERSADEIVTRMAERGVRVLTFGTNRLRAVFHLDIDDAMTEAACEALKASA